MIRLGPPKGAFYYLPWRRRQFKLAGVCQLVLFRPHASSLRKEAPCRAAGKKLPKENPSKGFSLDSFGNKRAAALLRSRESQIYSAHPVECLLRILEALSLACKHFLVCKMTNDFPAEQQIWKTCPPQGIFALQKSLRGGLRWGTGVLIAEYAVPAQRKVQRKFALRRVGSYKFVVPPTIEYSKVREHARFVTC